MIPTRPTLRRPFHIALMVDTSTTFGRQICRGVARYAQLHGHWVFATEERFPSSNVVATLKQWGADGIITAREDDQLDRRVARLGLPTVDVACRVKRPGIPIVYTDNDAVVGQVVQYFLSNGFRNLAYCGRPHWLFSVQRQAAFTELMQQKRFPLQVFTTPARTPGKRFEDQLGAWLKSLPVPTAVLACNDWMAQQILNACREQQITIPDEIAVMGVDNDELRCELSDPPLSSVEPDLLQQGFRAAQLLDAQLHGRSRRHPNEQVPPLRIIERQSTDAVAASDPATRAALHFIRQRACDGITVTDVLHHVQLSRTPLEERFARTLGHSIKAEIQRLRLNRVRQLLAETDLSLPAIARQTGFCTHAHMSVVFKAATQQTPGQFREMARPKSEIWKRDR